MKSNKLSLLSVLAVIFLLIFQGCRGTAPLVKSEGTAPSKEIDNATKITGVEEESAPRVSEFILGPGDKLEITVYRHEELNRNLQVDASGKIMYPLAGDIQASGLSIFQLRDRIRDGLSKHFVDPQVSVGVVSVQSQKIIVLGEVKNPGYFQADTPMDVLDAIAKAGGITLDGKQRNVLLIRGGMKNPELRTLDLEKALKKGDFTQNIMLQRGDVIYVPRSVIANVDRFFSHLSTIISPIVTMESGYFIGQRISEGGGTTAVGTR